MKEKFDNSILISRITSMCDVKGTSINKMLLESGAGTSTVDNLKKGSAPAVDKLVKIADRLETSTDYLLGRTDNPNMTITITSSPSITRTGELSTTTAGNIEHITINEETLETAEEKEILEMIKSLSAVQKAKVVLMIDNMKRGEKTDGV